MPAVETITRDHRRRPTSRSFSVSAGVKCIGPSADGDVRSVPYRILLRVRPRVRDATASVRGFPRHSAISPQCPVHGLHDPNNREMAEQCHGPMLADTTAVGDHLFADPDPAMRSPGTIRHLLARTTGPPLHHALIHRSARSATPSVRPIRRAQGSCRRVASFGVPAGRFIPPEKHHPASHRNGDPP